ncbi:hypothetical protein HYT84_00840 [Candidatus Micrarchaeota archaeon]|nr:hypothetical protein [Candidatus Micrarchaeota archaeon]
MTANAADIKSTLMDVQDATQTVLAIAFLLQLIIVVLGFGVWYFIRKKENLGWHYIVLAAVILLIGGGLISLLGGGILAYIYMKTRNIIMDRSNLTKYGLLIGSTLSLIVFALGILAYLLIPNIASGVTSGY